jgi:arachidonate 15-lipoxygenase
MDSIKAVEAAYDKLEEDLGSFNFVREFKELVDLMQALVEAPKDIEKAIKGVERLPRDLAKMVEGLAAVFKEFEKEGFTAFLKNTAYYMLETSHGRNYLETHQLADYEDVFDSLPLPDVLTIPLQDWMGDIAQKDICQQDWYFGYMQIAGFNTTNLKAVKTQLGSASGALLLNRLLEKMPLTDEILQSVSGDSALTLQSAAEQGLLYVCDYSMFEGLEGGKLHELQRYPVAPIALFYWNASPPEGYPPGGALQPVAIQLGQQYDTETTPIFTPNDETSNNDPSGAKWKLAKIMVQNTCTIEHETIAHLGACHLVIEPMIVAAHRQLPAEHPLLVLLTPHFRFTLQINDGAFHSLVVPGGVVASVISTSFPSTAELLVNAFNVWKFDEQFPDRLFESRGVTAGQLPSFPFREDTLELWSSIKTFVTDYLGLYYSGDKAVVEDYELQKWVNEMVNQKYAAVKGMAGLVETGNADSPYAINSLDYLIDVVSLIIYTASAQHASVNYAQYPLMSYIPAASGTLYDTPPSASTELEQEDIVKWLPPLDVALYQTSFAYLLTGVQFDTLGYYSDNPRDSYFADVRVPPLVAKFQMNLNKAEIDISQRNQSRPFPYVFQLPSMVPNSISI